MTNILVRVFAIGWGMLSAASVVAGVQMLLGSKHGGAVDQLPRLLDRVAPTSRWERILSTVLAVLLMRSFFIGSINTSLWPWAVVAWVALYTQLLFLRAHLNGYIAILERGFERPVSRYVAAHIALDVAMLVPLVAIATNGVT